MSDQKNKYSKFSKAALGIIKPQGSNSILDDLDLTLKEIKSARKEIRELYEGIGHCDTDEEELLIETMFDNITNGDLINILQNKVNLLMPDMKAENLNCDIKKTIEHLEKACEYKNDVYLSVQGDDQENLVNLKCLNINSVSHELQRYADIVKRFNSRLRNVEISEHLDMTRKRDLLCEEKLREFKAITDIVCKFMNAKSQVNNYKNKEKCEEYENDNLKDHVESLLSETDTVLYAVNHQQQFV